jgi:hypothetical protein
MDNAPVSRAPVYSGIGFGRAAAILVAVAAVVTALVFLPSRIRAVDRQVSEFAALSPDDRVLRAARGTDVDTGIYKLAQRVIPRDAPYYVATGPGVDVSTPVTYPAVGALGQLYLLPRVEVGDPHRARYVISYGGDLHSLDVRIGRVWRYKPGLEIAEVLR